MPPKNIDSESYKLEDILMQDEELQRIISDIQEASIELRDITIKTVFTEEERLRIIALKTRIKTLELLKGERQKILQQAYVASTDTSTSGGFTWTDQYTGGNSKGAASR